MKKRPRVRLIHRAAPAAVVAATAVQGAVPARKRTRGNGSAGFPILGPGVRPTEKLMAAMAGEFPTPTPPGHGAYPSTPSLARQPAKQRSMLDEVAYADPYRLFPEGSQYVYNPGALIARKGYSVIDEMRRDEQVKAALTFKKQAVIAAGWQVDPPEGDGATASGEVDEVTAFVREVLQALEGSFERTLLEQLTALDYGFSIAERVWEERDDGKVVLRALKVRRPHTFEFAQDAFGNVTGLRQQSRELPVEKFIVYSYDYEFSNPYGRSDLEACYRAWWTKRNAYMWLAMLLERLGIPPIFVLYNPNAYQNPERAAMQQILQRLQAGTVGLFPRPNKDAAEFYSPELAGQVSSVFIPAMDKFDKDISKALLMPGLIGMTADDAQGSLARSRVHFDAFMLVLERIRAEVQERVMQEQVIKPLVELNFGLKPANEMPQFKFLPITDEKTAELLDKWIALTSGGIVSATDEDERFIRQAMEFPEFDPDAAAERAERKSEEQIDMQKAKMDAGLGPILPPGAGKGPAIPPQQQQKDDGKGDGENGTKKMTLTDEQFERVLEELREAALDGLDE